MIVSHARCGGTLEPFGVCDGAMVSRCDRCRHVGFVGFAIVADDANGETDIDSGGVEA